MTDHRLRTFDRHDLCQRLVVFQLICLSASPDCCLSYFLSIPSLFFLDDGTPLYLSEPFNGKGMGPLGDNEIRPQLTTSALDEGPRTIMRQSNPLSYDCLRVLRGEIHVCYST